MANIWMKTPKGALAGVSEEAAENFLKKGWTYANDPIAEGWTRADGGTGNTGIMGEIDRAKNSRIHSRKAALENLRNKTHSNLQAEKVEVGQRYYDSSNAASTGSQMRARRLSELMANKGYSEGSQAQSQIATNVSLQGELGGLKRQKLTAEDSIARRGTEAEQDYQTGLLQAEADADTYAAEARLSELGKLRDYGRQDARQAVEDSRYADETAYNRGQTEKEQYASLVSRFYNDFMAEINKVKGDGDPSNDWQIPILEAARNQKIQGMEQQNKAQTDTDYERAMELWKMTGVADDNTARILGVPKGAKTADYNINIMQENRMKNQAGSSSSQRTERNDEWEQNYNEAISAYNQLTPEEMINNVMDYSSEVKGQVGPENYNRLVKAAQDRYYNALLTSWANTAPERILQSLANNQALYIKRLGDANYQKLYTQASNAYYKNNNGYYGTEEEE